MTTTLTLVLLLSGSSPAEMVASETRTPVVTTASTNASQEFDSARHVSNSKRSVGQQDDSWAESN